MGSTLKLVRDVNTTTRKLQKLAKQLEIKARKKISGRKKRRKTPARRTAANP